MGIHAEEKMSLDKMSYSLVLNGMLIILLGYSWLVGKDGTITTAIIGMIGLNAGAILGYQFAKKE